jgi:hypothetical protein
VTASRRGLVAPLSALDASPAERDIANRVRTIDYYTTLYSASGLPRSAFFLVAEHVANPQSTGHPVSFHHRYPDRNEYTS